MATKKLKLKFVRFTVPSVGMLAWADGGILYESGEQFTGGELIARSSAASPMPCTVLEMLWASTTPQYRVKILLADGRIGWTWDSNLRVAV